MNTDENRSSQTFIRVHPCASVAHIKFSILPVDLRQCRLQPRGGLASDPLPGLTAIVTGGSPALTGVYYDVAHSRNYNPPAKTTGNGLVAGRCTPSGPPPGTTTEFEVGQTKLNGGAPGASLTDGGIN